jgi:hypothetical protein
MTLREFGGVRIGTERSEKFHRNPASPVVVHSKMRSDCNFCDTPTQRFHSRDFPDTGGLLGIAEISPVDLNRSEPTYFTFRDRQSFSFSDQR